MLGIHLVQVADFLEREENIIAELFGHIERDPNETEPIHES